MTPRSWLPSTLESPVKPREGDISQKNMAYSFIYMLTIGEQIICSINALHLNILAQHAACTCMDTLTP